MDDGILVQHGILGRHSVDVEADAVRLVLLDELADDLVHEAVGRYTVAGLDARDALAGAVQQGDESDGFHLSHCGSWFEA